MGSATDATLPIGYILQKSDGRWYIKSDNSLLELDGQVISAERHPKLFALLKDSSSKLVAHSDESLMMLTPFRAEFVKK